MNLKENMSTKKLIEHPENKKLFKDIKEINPTFWLSFVNSIKEDGIIEPLIVNKETMQVRSGNQRLKAAIEIGLDTVPVLLVDETTTEDEIRKMISSNVFRRTIDAFKMFEYIGKLRKKSSPETPIVTKSQIKNNIHKSHGFIKAADIFKDLPQEQQEALDKWYHEKAEGEKAKSEGELIAMIKNMEANETTLKEELEKAKEKQSELKYDYEELVIDKQRSEDKISDLEDDIVTREKEIEILTNTDYENELEGKEVQINENLNSIKKLKDKIRELKETPDINLYLIESIKKLLDINVTLKSIMNNMDALNPVKLQEFKNALKVTYDIIKGTQKQEGQDDRRKQLND